MACSTQPVGAALSLSGCTSSGMDFKGRVAGLTGSSLFLERMESGSRVQVGIPITEIDDLQIHLNPSATGSILVDLESCLGILPCLSDSSLLELMEMVVALAKDKSREATYTWSERFYRAAKSTELRLAARMNKCHALLELGQFQALKSELAAMNGEVEPVGAPAMLCLLNAEMHRHFQQPEEALFWAALPGLQIPSHAGPLTGRLEELQALLNSDPQ